MMYVLRSCREFQGRATALYRCGACEQTRTVEGVPDSEPETHAHSGL